MEAALVENIQRSDLNPIEKAQGFAEYLERYGMTEGELGQRLGIGRTTISNLVNLLKLPADVQEKVRSGELSTGHAKVLKGLADPERQQSLCKLVILRQLSVRELEEMVKQQEATPAEPKADAGEKPAVEKSNHVKGIEDELRSKLSVKTVAIKLKAKDKGQILLSFESNDDFRAAARGAAEVTVGANPWTVRPVVEYDAG